MIKGKLENLEIELKMKQQAIGRLRQDLAKDQGYINELKKVRNTATRLVTKGNRKAELIVLELDRKLEKLSACADEISSNLEDHENRVELLELILGKKQTAYSIDTVHSTLFKQSDSSGISVADNYPEAETVQSQVDKAMFCELGVTS